MNDSVFAHIIHVDGLDLEAHYRYVDGHMKNNLLILDALTLVGDKRNIIDLMSGGVIDLVYMLLDGLTSGQLRERLAPTGVQY